MILVKDVFDDSVTYNNPCLPLHPAHPVRVDDKVCHRHWFLVLETVTVSDAGAYHEDYYGSESLLRLSDSDEMERGCE